MYKLTYSALSDNPNYKEETTSNVCFLGENSLYDIEYNKVLQWRLAENKESGVPARTVRNPVLIGKFFIFFLEELSN